MMSYNIEAIILPVVENVMKFSFQEFFLSQQEQKFNFQSEECYSPIAFVLQF